LWKQAITGPDFTIRADAGRESSTRTKPTTAIEQKSFNDSAQDKVVLEERGISTNHG
jgi:hypothetical protein